MNIRKNMSAILILTLVLTSLPVNAVKTFAGEDVLVSGDSLKVEQEVINGSDDYFSELSQDYGAETGIKSGTCGNDLRWLFDNTGTLTISGKGEMENYAYEDDKIDSHFTPWNNFRSTINRVIIENGVTSIGDYAFYGCDYLMDIEIAQDVARIGWATFDGCTRLTRIEIPESVTTIDNYAFYYCNNLSYIKFNGGVKRIGDWAFEHCIKLTDIVLPSDISSIKRGTFYMCTGLSNVEIPNNIASIEDEAFNGCGSLSNIYYKGGNDEWNRIVIGEYNNNILSASVHYNASIPNKSGTCGDNLTWTLNAEGVLTISGIGEMENYVDYEVSDSCMTPWNDFCNRINMVEISDGVMNIGDCAFSNCVNLKEIEISDSVTRIGNKAFNNCNYLTNIKIPKRMLTIGSNAFRSCINLTYIDIPSRINTINDYTFSGCKCLNSIKIPKSVYEIGLGAFMGCDNLLDTYYECGENEWKNIEIDYSNDYLKNSTIHFNSYFPNGNEKPGTCGENLTWYLDNDGILYINGTGPMTDYNHDTRPSPWKGKIINKVILNNGVSTIGDWAFYDCNSIQSIEIPSSVNSIGQMACAFTGLTNVEIPIGVMTVDSGAFSDCTSLRNVKIDGNLAHIEDHVFDFCDNLEAITIPSSVKSIGQYAFSRCRNLTHIDLPSSVEHIDEYAFYESGLTSAKLSYGLKDISEYAFSCCSNLETIELPESLEYIRSHAFDGCGLKSVIIPQNADIGLYLFRNCYNLETVKLPPNLERVWDYAFSNCQKLEKIEIPENVRYIGEGAFEGCTSLTNIQLPSKTEQIDERAFLKCYKLESIQIPVSLKKICINAFNSCTKLSDVYYGGNSDEWNDIKIEKNNSYLQNATIHYASSIHEEYHIVTFESNGGTVVEDVKVEHGKTVTKPSVPVRNNYDFAGWYSDEGLSQKYDFSTPVTTNVTLYAKWEEEEKNEFGVFEKKVPFTLHGEPDDYISIEWSWNDFTNVSYKYYQRLSIAGLVLSAAAEDSKERVEKVYSILGFKNIFSGNDGDDYYAKNDVFLPAMTFASKDIIINKKPYTIVSMTIRGTVGDKDTETDINSILDGFSTCGINAKKRLNDYMKNVLREKDLEPDNTILYITGHSLGGATAGVLAQMTGDITHETNTYIYTYASPRYLITKNSDYKEFPNVFNILNEDDNVPNIPPTAVKQIEKQGSYVGRVGEPRPYDKKDQSYVFDSYYKMLTKSDITYAEVLKLVDEPNWLERIPHPIAQLQSKICRLLGYLIPAGNSHEQFAHDVNTYMAFLLAEATNGYKLVGRHTMKLARVACPVDVEIYDENGNLQGKVINNEVSYPEWTTISIMTYEDEKYIFMPSDSDYKVKIVATDSGTMEYEIWEEDVSHDSIVTHKEFKDVMLTKGKTFVSEIVDEEVSDTSLLISDKWGKIVKKVNEDGTEADIKNDTVSVNKITFDITSHTIEAGKTFTITPVFDPTNATDKTLTWESDNTAVATVADGVVTAKAAGTANIKATTHNGKSAICKVVVTKENGINSGMPGSVITAKKVDISVAFEKSTEEIRFTIKDKSQKKLATVSSKGLLTAKKSGTVTITLQQKDGKTWKDIKDISYEIVVPKGSTLPFGKAYYEGQTWDLNTLIREYNTYSPDAWETKTKNSIATLDSNTGILTVGNTNGTATAYAIYGTGKYARKVKVAVKINHKKVDISGVFSSVSGKTRYKILDKVDRKRASVSTKGILTAKKDGSVTTTLQVKDGNTWRDVESKVIHITNPLQCISIEEPGQDTPANGKEYVVNRATGVFHRPDCYKVKEIQDKKYVTSTYQDMINKEYKACGICKPD